MINRNNIFWTIALLMIVTSFSCDSAPDQDFKAASIKKMLDKVKTIQQDLRDHCDSDLYMDAKKMADSVIVKK